MYVLYTFDVGGHRRVASDGSEKIFRDSTRFTSHPSGSGSQQSNPGASRERRYFESEGKSSPNLNLYDYTQHCKFSWRNVLNSEYILGF